MLQKKNIKKKNQSHLFDILILPFFFQWFLQFAFGKDENFWASSSPVNFPAEKVRNEKPSFAPWLIIQTPQDHLVDIAQADSFQKFLGRC